MLWLGSRCDNIDQVVKALYNIGYIKSTSREIWFGQNLFLDDQVILKFCAEHDSIIAVLCTKMQNEWTTETDVMYERILATFEFKLILGRTFYILQP